MLRIWRCQWNYQNLLNWSAYIILYIDGNLIFDSGFFSSKNSTAKIILVANLLGFINCRKVRKFTFYALNPRLVKINLNFSRLEIELFTEAVHDNDDRSTDGDYFAFQRRR